MAKPAGGARIVARDVLGAAWPLFQVSLPTCLPLTLVACVAGGSPVADAEPLGGTWWSVVAVRAAMVLICYGAMLRQQLQFAAGERPRLMQSLRDALGDVPAVLVLVTAWILPFVPAALTTAARGFNVLALLLTAAAAALLVFVLPAWPALISGSTNPWAALVVSVRLVRGRWVQLAGLIGLLLTGVLVFILLAGILLGMVMYLAGQGENPTPAGLAASRWLIGIVLAVLVTYVGAASVTTWRVLARLNR